MITIYNMDVMKGLARLEDESIHCVVTSPPYFRQRDYQVEGQIGLESTVAEYVEKMVLIFREVRRVLRKDGVVWLVIGDSLASASKKTDKVFGNPEFNQNRPSRQRSKIVAKKVPPGYRPKNLLGIPWRVAFALQDDEWYLRSDIIWQKVSPLPESVKDRPTRSHEYIFLLSKSARYFYDTQAVRMPPSESSLKRINQRTFDTQKGGPKDYKHGVNTNRSCRQTTENFAKNPGCNLRDVWTIPPAPYSGNHHATFPPRIPEICIKAGTSEKGVCPECGSPWKRIVKKGLTKHDGVTNSDYPKGSAANRLAKLRQAARERGAEYVNNSKTVEWQSTCDHGAQPIPCTVLDPFSGHSTSGLVASRLGRNYIGIEINPEDCEASKRRIENDAPLLNCVEIIKPDSP